MHRAIRVWGLITLALGMAVASSSLALAESIEVRRDVVYADRPSGPLTCDVYLPEGEGPFPAVLVVHGGAWKEGNGDKTQLFFIANRLAHQGFTAVAISYRLAPTHKFPAQIEDCKSAVRWLRTHAAEYKVNPDWIAGWGYSAGAHLVSLLGTSDPAAGLEGPDAAVDAPSTRLQCVIAGGTPSDFRVFPLENDQLAYWLGGTRAQVPALYDQASPAAYISGDDPPMFLYHGDADELVPLNQASAMVAELKQAGIDGELFVIPKARHVGAAIDTRAIRAGVDFLLAHLPGAAPTDAEPTTAEPAPAAPSGEGATAAATP